MTIKYQTKKNLEKPKHTIEKNTILRDSLGRATLLPLLLLAGGGACRGLVNNNPSINNNPPTPAYRPGLCPWRRSFWGRPAHVIVSENTLADLSI